jgi:hypothetical protein
VGATPDALFGQELMTPKDSTEWRNLVAARSLLSFSWRRCDVRPPSAVPFCSLSPSTTPWRRSGPPLRGAERAPLGELHRSRGGHYDVYEGGDSFDDVLRVELDFLHRQAKTP